MSIYKTKSDPIDKMASEYVRERDGYKCRKCHKLPHKKGLGAAHIFGRDRHELRYDPENLLSLCTACHQWFDRNKGDLFNDEYDGIKWLIKQIGDKALQNLRIRSQITTKKINAQFIWKHFYENENKRGDN